jgi:hypothetical protein
MPGLSPVLWRFQQQSYSIGKRGGGGKPQLDLLPIKLYALLMEQRSGIALRQLFPVIHYANWTAPGFVDAILS